MTYDVQQMLEHDVNDGVDVKAMADVLLYS